MKIYIIGLGVIFVIGNNVSEMFVVFLENKIGIKFGVMLYFVGQLVGEVQFGNEQLMDVFGFFIKGFWMVLFGMIVVCEVFFGYLVNLYICMGLILGIFVGGMDFLEVVWKLELVGGVYDCLVYFYYFSG